MAEDGHFWVDARINGQPIRLMVDSGASVTTLSRTTAAKADVDAQGMFPVMVGTANGTNIQQWPWLNNTAQKWTFASTGDGYYEIKNVNSGKLMEVAGLSRAEGGNVAIYGDSNVPQQHWAVTPTGDGYYYLTNRFSGLSLNVDAGSTADGANIDQLTYTRAPEEQWQIIAL